MTAARQPESSLFKVDSYSACCFKRRICHATVRSCPLYRNTVGFDRLFSMLDQLVSVDAAPSYPPYNIERTGENAYRISIAVAGFTDRDLTIEVKENALTIRGEKA